MNLIYQYWKNSQTEGKGFSFQEVAKHFGLSTHSVRNAINRSMYTKKPALNQIENQVLECVVKNGPEATTAQILAAMHHIHGMDKRERQKVRDTLCKLRNFGYIEMVNHGKYTAKSI